MLLIGRHHRRSRPLSSPIAEKSVSLAGRHLVPDAAGWVQVSSAAQLEYIDQNQSLYLNDKIELMNSVNLRGYPWVPLGNSSAFQGTFNGLGHTVSGVSITGATDSRVGFFGWSDGTIENVGVQVAVSGNAVSPAWIGGLVGLLDGNITNSFATGTVTSAGASDNGGLVGGQTGGSITSSYAADTVSGGSDTGGLVGQEYGGSIANSYATGTVTGGQYQGGWSAFNLAGPSAIRTLTPRPPSKRKESAQGPKPGQPGKRRRLCRLRRPM